MNKTENTRKNRQALERQGMTLLASTGDGLSTAQIGLVTTYDLALAGRCYVVPVKRHQFRGHEADGPTTWFRFATDDEI